MSQVSLTIVGTCSVDLLVNGSSEFIESNGLVNGGTHNAVLRPEFKKTFRDIKELGNLVMKPGGSAANTAVMYAGLGGTVRFVGSIGNDNEGQYFRESMRESGCDTAISVLNGQSTCKCLGIIDESGERTIVVAPDANRYVKVPDTTSDTIFCVEGYSLQYQETRENIISELEARRKLNLLSVITASDASVVNANKPLFIEFLKQGDSCLFVLNQHEIEAILDSEVLHCAEYLAYNNLSAVITLGKDGALVIENGEVVKVKPTRVPSVQIVDTIGAGDAFLGGLIYAHLELGKSLKDSALAGNLCAAAVVRQDGARLDDYSALKSAINITGCGIAQV